MSQSVKELEVHSRIFDEMGFLPASPYNKINIHVGGTYGGEKEPVLRRFAQVWFWDAGLCGIAAS